MATSRQNGDTQQSTTPTPGMRRQGYEAVFDPQVDRKYICPICLAVIRDAMQTKCGHRFCKCCIQGIVRPRRNVIYCPVDKSCIGLQTELFEDNAVNREILSMSIKCDQHELGCVWTGELREQENHMMACPFITTMCINDNCGVIVQRQEMSSHLISCPRRKVDCASCEKKVAFADMNKHFLLDCCKFPVNCTSCGRVGIPRDELAEHKNPERGDCPQSVVPCPFAFHGCTIEVKRENLTSHHREAIEQHLIMLANSYKNERTTAIHMFNKLSEHIINLQKKLEDQQQEIRSLKQQ